MVGRARQLACFTRLPLLCSIAVFFVFVQHVMHLVHVAVAAALFFSLCTLSLSDDVLNRAGCIVLLFTLISCTVVKVCVWSCAGDGGVVHFFKEGWVLPEASWNLLS